MPKTNGSDNVAGDGTELDLPEVPQVTSLTVFIEPEDVQLPSNSKENSEETNNPVDNNVHVESLQIPHLRIVGDSNMPTTNTEGSESSKRMVKMELVLQEAEGDGNEDHFDESMVYDLVSNPVPHISQDEDGEANTERLISDSINREFSEHKTVTKQEVLSENKLKNVPIEMPKSTFCAHCNTPILDETSASKNFHEFLPLQYYNTATGDYADVQIIDAFSEIFKLRWTCSTFGEIYKRSDLAICLECASTLAQVYKMYNQFAALAIKAKSFLSEVINFQKDLQLEDKCGENDDEKGSHYGNNVESEYQGNATWKRNRRVKKVQRYVEDDDDEDEDDSSDSDMENSGCIIPNQKKKTKSKILIQDSENEDSSFAISKPSPSKKLIGKKLISEKTLGGHEEFTVRKIDIDEDLSAFEVPPEDENVCEGDEDEGNVSLQLLLRKYTNPSSLDAKGKALKCKECNKEFKFPIQLRIHLNSKYHKDNIKMLRLEEEGSEGEGKPKRRNRKQGLSKGGSFRSLEKSKSKSCNDCGKKFSKSRDLARHKKCHHNLKQAGECDRCAKKFKTLGGLKIHYAAHVRDDNKYACKDCGKKFRKSEALELHEKTDHGGFKPHLCTLCDKRFRLKDKLKLHMMVIHEKKKPFPCPKCEKSFRTKYHLKIHDVSQHIQGGDTSMGCSQCKRKFLDREALEKHIAVHEQEKPFVCISCGKGFHTSARLKLHEKSHQEVPSCLCPVCGRAYKHIRDLKLHEVVHQDESTYRFGCGDCPRRFYRIDLLRVHQSNEKHFASEVIGPTVSKSLTSNKDISYFQAKEDLLDDEEDDENETDNEAPLPPPPKPKKRKKVNPRERLKLHPPVPREREMTVMHPHATVIYHPSSMVQLHLDQPSGVPTSSGMRSDSSLPSNTPNNLTLATHHPRYAHDTQVSSGSYIMSQRDRQNIPHYSGIQLQPVSSASHPHIQFGNNTVYTMRDVAGNPTLNVANVSGAVSVSGAEQIGFDIITSFINNLG